MSGDDGSARALRDGWAIVAAPARWAAVSAVRVRLGSPVRR